jgi:hypothetical protein
MRNLFIKFNCPYKTYLKNMINIIHGSDDLLYKVLLPWFMCSIPYVSERILWMVEINKVMVILKNWTL